jgi:hypothetical protein
MDLLFFFFLSFHTIWFFFGNIFLVLTKFYYIWSMLLFLQFWFSFIWFFFWFYLFHMSDWGVHLNLFNLLLFLRRPSKISNYFFNPERFICTREFLPFRFEIEVVIWNSLTRWILEIVNSWSRCESRTA